MAEEPAGTLVRLMDSELTLADPEDDLRGRLVVDSNGEEVGSVEDLMIDETERRARFLQVGSGGFLGIGEKRQLIPVDAIVRTDADTVYLSKDRHHVAGAQYYDPTVAVDRGYYADLYNYWGYTPFWIPGYTYPRYPIG
jgi:sporulation protein YlmC with PRC-barrel domain